MFFHAKELQETLARRESRRKYLYQIQLEKCLNHIKSVHRHNPFSDYTFFSVPYSMTGEPFYDFKGCIDYIRQGLKDHGFYRKLMAPGDKFFISWDPNLTPSNPKEKERETQDIIIDYDPNDPVDAERARMQLLRLANRQNNS